MNKHTFTRYQIELIRQIFDLSVIDEVKIDEEKKTLSVCNYEIEATSERYKLYFVSDDENKKLLISSYHFDNIVSYVNTHASKRKFKLALMHAKLNMERIEEKHEKIKEEFYKTHSKDFEVVKSEFCYHNYGFAETLYFYNPTTNETKMAWIAHFTKEFKCESIEPTTISIHIEAQDG